MLLIRILRWFLFKLLVAESDPIDSMLLIMILMFHIQLLDVKSDPHVSYS